MKFITHNTPNEDIEFQSSWLQGYIEITYNEIKKIFGNPLEGDGYKTDAEWVILFDNDTYATIYNYKDGKNYNGKDGTPKSQITDWHVGGSSATAVTLVTKALGL